MRKVETLKAPASCGRDAGKLYRITEMAAVRAEKWAVRALMLVTNGNGGQIPEHVASLGMEGIFIAGINVILRSRMDYEELEPLLDEMMTCIEIVRDPRTPEIATALVSDDDIEEVGTRIWLRGEVLRLHTGFSVSAALSALISKVLSQTSQAA